MIIEICLSNYNDCLIAQSLGIKRIELNSALFLGGLTPSLALLQKVKTSTNLEVMVMIRNRGGGFNYTDEEINIMLSDARIMLDNGADGIVFGCLNPDGTLAKSANKQFVQLAHKYHKQAVFHRAFDCCVDPFTAIEELISLNIDRVLTSGQAENALQGKELIKELIARYGNQIEILPGCGINSTNVQELIKTTHTKQIHASCMGHGYDNTTATKQVSYRYTNNGDYEILDENKLVNLLTAVNE